MASEGRSLTSPEVLCQMPILDRRTDFDEANFKTGETMTYLTDAHEQVVYLFITMVLSQEELAASQP